MSLVPYVVEQTARGERSYDIFSRLLNDRIIVLSEDVNSASASVIVAQLLYLEGQDPEALVRERGLKVVADEGALKALVAEAIAAMPEAAESVRQGKVKALDALVGQVMRKTRGQARPDLVRRLLLEALGVG